MATTKTLKTEQSEFSVTANDWEKENQHRIYFRIAGANRTLSGQCVWDVNKQEWLSCRDRMSKLEQALEKLFNLLPEPPTPEEPKAEPVNKQKMVVRQARSGLEAGKWVLEDQDGHLLKGVDKFWNFDILTFASKEEAEAYRDAQEEEEIPPLKAAEPLVEKQPEASAPEPDKICASCHRWHIGYQGVQTDRIFTGPRKDWGKFQHPCQAPETCLCSLCHPQRGNLPLEVSPFVAEEMAKQGKRWDGFKWVQVEPVARWQFFPFDGYFQATTSDGRKVRCNKDDFASIAAECEEAGIELTPERAIAEDWPGFYVVTPGWGGARPGAGRPEGTGKAPEKSAEYQAGYQAGYKAAQRKYEQC